MNLSVEIPHKNWSRKFDLNIAIETRVLRWGPVQKRQIHSRVLRSPHRSLEHGHYQGLQGAMMKKVHVDVSMQNRVISCNISIMYINIVYMYICIWYIYRDYGCVQNLKEKIQHDIYDAPKSEANSLYEHSLLMCHRTKNAVCIRLFHGPFCKARHTHHCFQTAHCFENQPPKYDKVIRYRSWCQILSDVWDSNDHTKDDMLPRRAKFARTATRTITPQLLHNGPCFPRN